MLTFLVVIVWKSALGRRGLCLHFSPGAGWALEAGPPQVEAARSACPHGGEDWGRGWRLPDSDSFYHCHHSSASCACHLASLNLGEMSSSQQKLFCPLNVPLGSGARVYFSLSPCPGTPLALVVGDQGCCSQSCSAQNGLPPRRTILPQMSVNDSACCISDTQVLIGA